MLKSFGFFKNKMGCANSHHEIKHPNKPLPVIPAAPPIGNYSGNDQNSIAQMHMVLPAATRNQISIEPDHNPYRNNSIIGKDRSNSCNVSNSYAYSAQQQQQQQLFQQQSQQPQQPQQQQQLGVMPLSSSLPLSSPMAPISHLLSATSVSSSSTANATPLSLSSTVVSSQQSPPPIESSSEFVSSSSSSSHTTATAAASALLSDAKAAKKAKKKSFLTWGKKAVSIGGKSNDSISSRHSSSAGSGSPRPPLPTPPAAQPSNGPSQTGTGKQSESPAAAPSNQKIVIALYSYEARDEGELSFEKNEKLVVTDSSEPDWWLAFKITAPESQGYIPNNFVVSNVIETEEWFFPKIVRRVAERLLLDGDYPRGTFLIRNSEQDTGKLLTNYSLSIRDWDPLKFEHVKHYKIQTRPNGDFFITSRRSFVKLADLIEYYSSSANGLCYRLTKPCPKQSVLSANPRILPGGEIDRRDLKFVRELGSGNFGKVFFGLYRGSTKVAIKTLKPNSMTPTAFMQEAAIMRRYRHEKLVSLYGVCSRGMPLLIITEYMPKGALLNYLRDNPESQILTIIDLIDMAAQIASGMSYLEKVKLVHRDLAARNCLVGGADARHLVVKVADFGLARIVEEDYYVSQTNAKFPVKWTAPEAASRGKFTSKSDVWSFGILLYEIITKGQIPYPGMTNRDVIEQVERGYRMPKPKSVECPNSLYQIMLQCWERDPDKRPTFEYLYGYFDDFFVSAEPGYRDPEDIQPNSAAGPVAPRSDDTYDLMVK